MAFKYAALSLIAGCLGIYFLDTNAQQQVLQPGISTSLFTSEINDFINDVMEKWGIVGVSLGVLLPNGEVELKGFGNSTENGDPVNPETLFGIASCSKAFTSAAMGILIDDYANGRNTTPLPSTISSLDWSTKVVDLIPAEWSLRDPWASSKTSLIDLLSHKTGLPRHDLSTAPGDTSEVVVSRLRHLKPNHELREQFQYNNLMYVTAAHILNTYTGNFPEFVEKRIFQPLGMESSTYHVEDAIKSGKLTHGWDSQTRRRMPSVFGLDIEEVSSGDGGIITSATDMIKWLKALLSNGLNKDSNTAVPPSSVVKMVTDGHSISINRPPWPEVSISTYGLGWMQNSYQGHNIISHGGGFLSASTLTEFYPDDGLGIFIASNVDRTHPALQVVAYRIAEEVLRLRRIDWVNRLWTPPLRIELPHAENLSIALDKFTGNYGNVAYGFFNLCDLTSESYSQLCAEIRNELKKLGIQNGLGSYWPRLTSSHMHLQPINDTLGMLTLLNVFPDGFGKNKTPFYIPIGQTIVRFGLDSEGNVYGGGFSENPEELLEAEEGELMEKSMTWFDRKLFK